MLGTQWMLEPEINIEIKHNGGKFPSKKPVEAVGAGAEYSPSGDDDYEYCKGSQKELLDHVISFGRERPSVAPTRGLRYRSL